MIVDRNNEGWEEIWKRVIQYENLRIKSKKRKMEVAVDIYSSGFLSGYLLRRGEEEMNDE